MGRQLSRAQRQERFLQCAAAMFEQLEVWYDAHAEASFGEIEAEARRQRRVLMGAALELLINGRSTGLQVEAPHCAQCGSALCFHEYRRKTIRGLEGNSCLERAYYVCPNGCGETLFPPGPATALAGRPLE